MLQVLREIKCLENILFFLSGFYFCCWSSLIALDEVAVEAIVRP